MSRSSLHLLLIRHAEAMPYSAADPDPILTARGRYQAALLAAWMQEAPPDEIVSSTLRRAAETAAILARRVGMPVRLDPRLREVGTCSPDPRPIHGARSPAGKFAPRDRPFESMFPGGERWVDFRERVRLAIQQLLDGWANGADRHVAVVCHGGVVDAFLDNITNATGSGRVEAALAHTGISHFEFRSTSATSPWVLHSHNLAPHLAVADYGQQHCAVP